MREFSFPIQRTLGSGLRKDFRQPRNTNTLDQCFNLKPIGIGLTFIDSPVYAAATDWPFPQLFHLRESGQLILASRSAISFVTSLEPTVSTALTTYDSTNLALEKAVAATGQWHLADFGEVTVMFNGAQIVFSDPSTGKNIVSDEITIGTGCEHRGRLITAGFSSSDTHPVWGRLEENEVAWSTIGGGDAFWPFMASLVDSERQEHYEIRNEAGYMPMPFEGTIHAVKTLDRVVIVYGENGVAALIPFSAPTPTFGLRPLLNVGIANRAALAGDHKGHAFIDKAGYLWVIGVDFVPKRIGYREQFSSLTSTVVGSYDPLEDEMYFSVDGTCYILTPSGLCEFADDVSGIARVNNDLYGAGDTGALANTFILKTDAFDMGFSALKSIEGIEVGYHDIGNLKVGIDYSYDGSGTFSSFPIGGAGIDVNDEGFAYIGITARDFKVRVFGDYGTRPRIDYITVRWKFVDKRMIRGATNAR